MLELAAMIGLVGTIFGIIYHFLGIVNQSLQIWLHGKKQGEGNSKQTSPSPSLGGDFSPQPSALELEEFLMQQEIKLKLASGAHEVIWQRNQGA